MKPLPKQVQSWIGQPVVKVQGVLVAGEGLWQNFCAAVEDANPLYWQSQPELIEGGPISPPAMLPAWVVGNEWSPPGAQRTPRPLELHFMLKDALGLPYGIVSEVENLYARPVRAGDLLHAEQVLREISDEYRTRMGPGRRWSIAVNYYHDDGGLAGIQTLRFTSYRRA